ncbi:MAG: AAA family ATPase [Polyangia bacterium]
MSEGAIRFEKVAVHRAPGVEPGRGWSLRELSPGINLIHGPNGCGKTTTALAMQALLWPRAGILERPLVEARLRRDRDVWDLRLDAGHLEQLGVEATAALPEVGPAEHRSRYWIALHELIGANDAELARIIARATQGGYDLEAAAKAAGFDSAPSDPRKLRKDLNDAGEAVRDAKTAQQDIQEEADTLEQLRRERNEAVDAGSRMDLVRKALERRRLERDRRELRGEIEALPPALERMRGDESETLRKLAERLDRLENDRRDLLRRKREAEAVTEKLGLPPHGANDGDLRRARALCRQLPSVESEIAARLESEKRAEKEAELSRGRLGPARDDARLEDAEEIDPSSLTDYARSAHRLHARRQVAAERRRRAEAPAAEEIRDLDAGQLSDGLAALGRWLSVPAPSAIPASRRTPLLLAAAAIVLLAVALAILHHPAWLIAALLGPIAVVAGLLGRGSRAPDEREVHRRDFERSGLPAPRSWSVEAVSEHVARLFELLALRKEAELRSQRLEELEHESSRLESERESLEQRRSELRERLGFEVELDDEWLPTFVDNLERFRQSIDAAAAARQSRLQKEMELRRGLDELRGILERYGYERVASAAHAERAVDDLEDRQRRLAEAQREAHSAAERLEREIGPQIEENLERKREIFERLELDERDATRIDAWLALLPRWKELQKGLTEKDAILASLAAELEGDEDLLDLGERESEQRLYELKQKADLLQQLSERIGRIEKAIESAESKRDLSVALECRDEAAAALAEAREENRAAVVGHLLAEWVRSEAVERSRPEVFRRADELLVGITNGMLRLSVNDRGPEPIFAARCGDEPPRPVERLSVGERVQLLVAVRLAFMEQDERAAMPLFFDEALATSDDERAARIIEGAIAIAATGRQVFYLTAQSDELGKWLPRLREAGVPHESIDLAALRGISAAERRPLRIVEPRRPELPEPAGCDRAEYARLLNVPGIDPTVESLAQLHLWHVVHDLDELHRLLKAGVEKWGQLDALLAGGGGRILGDSVEKELVLTRVEAIRAACRAWRVGRGRPVDRAALIDSGCVSESFIDEIAKLAGRCEGDAARLLRELGRGAVKRWRASKTEQLEGFLAENGYLPGRKPLAPEEIRVRALAAVARPVRKGRLDPAWIEAMAESLPRR